MLSEHELVCKVRKLYPKTKNIEEDCLKLFNKAVGLRGPTGLLGDGELSFTIQYLRSAANLLERIGVEKGLLLK